MSVHRITYQNGVKMMHPVRSRAEYLALRNTPKQKATLDAVRIGNEDEKRHLVQMNYSCLPNEDGSLKGSTRMSTTVGMDIDHIGEGSKIQGVQDTMEQVKERILAKKDELGLLMLERSARAAGYHLVFRRHPEMDQEDNLRWASNLLGVAYDEGAKDITRVFFTTTADEEELLYLDDEIFRTEECSSVAPSGLASHTAPTAGVATPACNPGTPSGLADNAGPAAISPEGTQRTQTPACDIDSLSGLNYNGIPYSDIIRKWWELYNEGKTPVRSNRDVLTFELAVNLRHICGFDRALLDRVIPCYDDFPQEQKMKCIDSALAEKRTQMPRRLRDVLMEVRRERMAGGEGGIDNAGLDEALMDDDRFYYDRLPKMPLGVRDSIAAVRPALTMPVVTAVCPAIGALATGVQLDIHGQKRGLNLISYIVGDPASGKGDIDPVVLGGWMDEVMTTDKMYLEQEKEWRRKAQLAKNKKEQPEEPQLPVRYLPLNNTVANVAERLANTGDKHAFSFTPEADTLAQKWGSNMTDFSIMLRQSYDNSRYDREARSLGSVNVHIDHLRWNVTMCGTTDALFRVVKNYTDGFQTRIALARTPDNAYAPLEDKTYTLTDIQREHIRQVAHLLPLMQGDAELPRLEAKGRAWLETIRLEAMKNDDKVKARQRFRTCVTAQRMVCCLMLCHVCEHLIRKYGTAGAEQKLRENPDLWRTMLQKAQTPQLLAAFDVIADYLMDTALHFFRDRIESAYNSRDYTGGSSERRNRGRNDSIYERLDAEFGFDGAYQHSVSVKGAGVSRNSVHQMLKNWTRQGLIVKTENGRFRKVKS